jgi:hypothetical protein
MELKLNNKLVYGYSLILALTTFLTLFFIVNLKLSYHYSCSIEQNFLIRFQHLVVF